MPPADTPIRSTDADEDIEANIIEARLNNERERTLTVEAPEGPPPIRATEVPRDDEHRERDVTPTAYLHPEDRAHREREVAMGPYVGPIDGEGTDIEEQEEAVVAGSTGGRYDKDGNLLFDPGVLPGERHDPPPPGPRDEDGNLIADHDGDGKAAAHEGPIREAIGVGASPDESEEEQHGSRSLDDPDRDLDVAADTELAPEHDPDASEEEQKGGRGIEEQRDLGDAEDAGKVPEHSSFLEHADPSPEAEGSNLYATDTLTAGTAAGAAPSEDASAEEWRQYARSSGVEVSPTANKAVTKSALREAGVIR